MFSMKPLNFGYPMHSSYPGQTTVNYFPALSAALGVPVTLYSRSSSPQMHSAFPDLSEQLLQIYNKIITEQGQAEQQTRVELNQNPLISSLMYPAFPGLSEQLLQIYNRIIAGQRQTEQEPRMELNQNPLISRLMYPALSGLPEQLLQIPNRTITGQRLAEQEPRVELNQNRVGIEGNISSTQVVREELVPVDVQSHWLNIKVKWRRILYGLRERQTLKRIREYYFPNDKNLGVTQISKALAQQLRILRKCENNSSKMEKLAGEMNLDMEEIQELKDKLENRDVQRQRKKRKSVSRVSQEVITKSKKTKTESNKPRNRIYGPKWKNLEVRWKLLLGGLRRGFTPSRIVREFFSDDKNVNATAVANALRNKLHNIKVIPPTNQARLANFAMKMGFQLKELEELTGLLKLRYEEDGRTIGWKNLKMRWRLIFNGLKQDLNPKEIAKNLFSDDQSLTAKMVSDTLTRKLKILRRIENNQTKFKYHATRMGLTVEELQDVKKILECRYSIQQSTLPSDDDLPLDVRSPLLDVRSPLLDVRSPLLESLAFSLSPLAPLPLSPKESEQLK